MQAVLNDHRPPLDLRESVAGIRYDAVELGPINGDARVVGAWSLHADDSRFGGLSGLAAAGDRLLALSDSGFIFVLDPTARSGRVKVVPLPSVPGDPRTKAGRDSEALAADPLGRGWWVAFEGRHALMLYDPAIRRRLRQVSLAQYGFRRNRGIEALISGDGKLFAIPEATGISDAVRLADGRTAFLERSFGKTGFVAHVAFDGRRWRLPIAPWDNPEGIAAAPLPNGGTRLWIVTDNDASPSRRTLLIAVDVAPTGRR